MIQKMPVNLIYKANCLEMLPYSISKVKVSDIKSYGDKLDLKYNFPEYTFRMVQPSA